MRIHVGCELSFEFPQTTPMIVTLNVHFSRFSDLERPDYLMTTPSVPVEGYRDSFGNWCSRLVAPTGRFSLGTNAVVRDAGAPEPAELDALQHQVQHLPADTLLFLLGSRYCETDRLSNEAWRLFGPTPLGNRRAGHHLMTQRRRGKSQRDYGNNPGTKVWQRRSSEPRRPDQRFIRAHLRRRRP